ncbi:uncharacterized protein LOC110974454 [Acanthaster planci]|uniref:Uncharacterized protein LOC110974454 n=1 Tax=Acanthaster planci TaxID=133434 RepID=A0A8B7XLW3_ACAPL|nr:uncharacterized protein LOC110974454 [Acanthaster planci]
MATQSGSTNTTTDLKRPMERGVPTLEDLLQQVMTFANIKEARIKELEAQVERAERENLQLKEQAAAWFLEKKALNAQIKELKDKFKTPKDKQVRNVSSEALSINAEGDGSSRLTSVEDQGPSAVGNLLANSRRCQIGGEHPASTPSSISSQVEADCAVTDLPNTHLPQAFPTKFMKPTADTAALGGSKEAVAVTTTDPAKTQAAATADFPDALLKSAVQTAGGTALGDSKERLPITETSMDVTKAAAVASQRAAVNKLDGESCSMAEISSRKEGRVRTITTDMMTWLSENLSRTEWKPLLRKMGLSDNEIDNASDGSMRIVEQRYQCFFHWRQTRGNKASVDALLAAIHAKSLKQLAFDFCEEFPEETSPAEATCQPEPSAPRIFSSQFVRFMWEFVDNGNRLLQDLHGCSKLSPEQCQKLGYHAKEEYVDIVLKHWSSKYYSQNNSDKSFDKRKELWKVLQCCGKKVRDVFKKHVDQGGVIGPAMDWDTKIENLSYSTTQVIEEKLSTKDGVMHNWKDLADWLRKRHQHSFEPVTNHKIKMWDQDLDPQKGARSILSIWETTTQAKVGVLYEWLVQNARLDIAVSLE